MQRRKKLTIQKNWSEKDQKRGVLLSDLRGSEQTGDNVAKLCFRFLGNPGGGGEREGGKRELTGRLASGTRSPGVLSGRLETTLRAGSGAPCEVGALITR